MTLTALARPSWLALVAGALLASGCTQSFQASYTPGQGITAISPAKTQSIAVARFEDKRSFAQRNDKNAGAFIATQSPWMFGLTYKGKKYTPVSDLVQDVLVSEFNAAGVKAVAIDAKSSDPATLQEAARQAPADFALAGQILAFEFANDAGMWTVTSRRTVTLAVTLLPVEGQAVFTNMSVTHSDAENEGMAVMHTTNVEKLMGVALKDVVNQVLAAVAARLSMLPSDVEVRISCGGRTWSHRVPARTPLT